MLDIRLQSRSSVTTALLARDLPGLCLLRPGPCPPAGSCTGIAPFSLPWETLVGSTPMGVCMSCSRAAEGEFDHQSFPLMCSQTPERQGDV